MIKVGTATVVGHTVKHCLVTHDNPLVPAVLQDMEKAVMDGQLERVKELYESSLADEETGADFADGMFKSEA